MFLLFLGMWIIFNGNFTWEILFFGLGISALMFLFFCKFMDYSLRKDLFFVSRIIYVPAYIFYLLRDIVKANLDTIKRLFSSEYDIEPCVVTFHTTLKTRWARVLLANAITLTPGTITASLEGNEYKVHCLDRDNAFGMADSDIARLLARMEGGWEKCQ